MAETKLNKATEGSCNTILCGDEMCFRICDFKGKRNLVYSDVTHNSAVRCCRIKSAYPTHGGEMSRLSLPSMAKTVNSFKIGYVARSGGIVGARAQSVDIIVYF
jgi:hypothetical protein